MNRVNTLINNVLFVCGSGSVCRMLSVHPSEGFYYWKGTLRLKYVREERVIKVILVYVHWQRGSWQKLTFSRNSEAGTDDIEAMEGVAYGIAPYGLLSLFLTETRTTA